MTTNTEVQWQIDSIPAATMRVTAYSGDEAAVVVFMEGNEEALKVTNHGFYVRGVKVEQSVTEASEVYNAFRQWLEWSLLNTQ